MCNFFDDFDSVEDFANLAGFIETQLEGEREEKEPDEPSPDDLLEYYDPLADDEPDQEADDEEQAP